MSDIINNPTGDKNDIAFVIEPLVYQPTLTPKPARFLDMFWDDEPASNGAARKQLLLVTELDEKDENGRPVQVTQAFNFLPRGRGKSEFKKQMESFSGTALTPAELAGFKKSTIVGKPVIVNYKTDHLGHIVFDKYTSPKPTQPAAS